jgi:hypothetical protein
VSGLVARGFWVMANGTVYIDAGTVFDGASVAASKGIYVQDGGLLMFDDIDFGASSGYPLFRNWAYGIYADSGADITHTTNVQYATNTVNIVQAPRVTSFLKVLTRDMTAATGSVSYTGVGFKPTAIMFIAATDGVTENSTGYTDSALNQAAVALLPTALCYNIPSLVIYLAAAVIVTIQEAGVISFDEDGFTLLWTKVGTPAVGTGYVKALCFR